MMFYSACLPALLPGRSDLEALQLLHGCGVEAFEIWSWWDRDLDALCDAQQKTGLRAAALCTRFIPLNDPSRREDYIIGLKESIAAAKKLNCRTIISQVGQERIGVSRQEQHQAIVDGLKACVPMLEAENIQLVIEPLNTLVDHKGYYLTSSQEGFEIVREVGSAHVRLIYDVYHQQIMEGNLLTAITDNIDLIGHIHIAGVPGRHEPLKQCEISYPTILAKLAQLGYQGAVGLEYFPLEDVEKGLRELLSLRL